MFSAFKNLFHGLSTTQQLSGDAVLAQLRENLKRLREELGLLHHEIEYAVTSIRVLEKRASVGMNDISDSTRSVYASAQREPISLTPEHRQREM